MPTAYRDGHAVQEADAPARLSRDERGRFVKNAGVRRTERRLRLGVAARTVELVHIDAVGEGRVGVPELDRLIAALEACTNGDSPRL
jgi:hypothetical protein